MRHAPALTPSDRRSDAPPWLSRCPRTGITAPASTPACWHMPACVVCRLQIISALNTPSRKPFWQLSLKCVGSNLNGCRLARMVVRPPILRSRFPMLPWALPAYATRTIFRRNAPTACRRITSSMMANPVMVSGVGRFDTRVMEVCSKRIVAKGGAEGYLALGIMAGALGAESPGIGIVFQGFGWRPVGTRPGRRFPQPCPSGHGA